MKKKITNSGKNNLFQMKNIVIAGILVLAVSFFLFGKNKDKTSVGALAEGEVAVTDANFDQLVLKSDKIVMVDFWATWCRPCQMMGPIVQEISKEYQGKIVVGKLDVDQNSGTAAAYNIESIPTILFFKNGKVIDQFIGLTSKEEMKRKIDFLITNNAK